MCVCVCVFMTVGVGEHSEGPATLVSVPISLATTPHALHASHRHYGPQREG